MRFTTYLDRPRSSVLLLSFAALAVACSSSDDGTPGGGAGTAPLAGPPGASGSGSPSGGAPSGGSSGVAGASAGVAGSAQGGSGGASAGTAGATGIAGGSVGGSPAGGSAGAAAGSGGASGSPSGGSAGSEPMGGTAGSGGSPGVACPANASFCSGFEEDGLPKGAVYKLNGDPATPWTHDFEIDKTVHRSGNASLRVRTNTEASGAYKMLAVPTPGAAFWVRFYIRSDVDLGTNDHNVYAMAAGSDSPNDTNNVEFAEDVGIAFNSHDSVRWPMNYGRLQNGTTMPFTLPKDTWHCIEIAFDGQGKTQQLFIDGTQRIDATDFPAMSYAFTTFKFGYNALHGTVRKTWYDDVAVAPTRVNCL